MYLQPVFIFSDMNSLRIQYKLNPYMTNGLSHRYRLGELTVIFGDNRGDFRLLFTFSMNFLQANLIAPMGRRVLELFCLPTFHKRTIGLNIFSTKGR